MQNNFFNHVAKENLCGPQPYGGVLSCTAATMIVAIFVIAGMGMTGQINSTTMGWTLTGLSGGMTITASMGASNILKNTTPTKEERKEAIARVLVPLVLTILSCLAGLGVISGSALGWCVFGPPLAAVGVSLIILVSIAIYKARQPDRQES